MILRTRVPALGRLCFGGPTFERDVFVAIFVRAPASGAGNSKGSTDTGVLGFASKALTTFPTLAEEVFVFVFFGAVARSF